MRRNQPARPVVLFHFFRAYAVLGLAPFLINTIDILLNLSAPSLGETPDPVNRALLGLLVAPLVLVIAVLCVRRAPGNLVGWLLFPFAYGISVGVIRDGLLPVQVAVLLANMVISQFWFAFLILPLFFPDGFLYPARLQRIGSWLLPILIFSTWLIVPVSAPTHSWGSGSTALEVPNPLYLLDWNYTQYTIPMMLSLLITAVVTTILRYRGSRSIERLQLRWMFFGVLFQAVLTAFTFVAPAWLDRYFPWLTALYALISPTAVGVAVLRYRLYDIDLIIRRTLQYGLLSVLLGLVYFGLVVLLGQAFQGATGQQSPLVIVVSTLAIAALFNPLRRRVQAWIDRRFFRRRYDAAQAVESFTLAARSQVEISALAGRLVETARETLQPEDVWVWIRKEGRSNTRETGGVQWRN